FAERGFAQTGKDKAPVRLRMSATEPQDSSSAQAIWYERLSSNLKAAVGNKIVVDYFPSDKLGKEPDVVAKVKAGDVDMMMSGAAAWSALIPEMGVLDLGYLFKDNGHFGRSMDGQAGGILADMLEERGNAHILGWCFSVGPRNLWTKAPVK